MRDFDARAVAAGTPGTVLMGRACRGLAREFFSLCAGSRPSVLICAGPGNNGGDGFGLAAHLHLAGWRTEVWVTSERARVGGDALAYLQWAESVGVPLTFCPDPEDWPVEIGALPCVDWVVDAVLGTGTGDAPRKTPAAAVATLRALAADARVLAVDLPTGLDADRGVPFDPEKCVRADATFTLGAAKAGFLADASAYWTGPITVIDLGFSPEELAQASVQPISVMHPARWAQLNPRRDPESHKGTYGHVLVIGGSPGMTGAVAMSAKAALRSGAGLVSMFVPASAMPFLDAALPEIMVRGGRETSEGTLAEQKIDFSAYTAAVIGPGLGKNPETAALLRQVFAECPIPLVVDADALRLLADAWADSNDCPTPAAPRVLTPHPGEMAALCGCDTADVQSVRAEKCLEAAKKYQSVVVLKGNRTRICFPNGDQWLNLNGNPGMATGGSGDVLAGMLAGLLGRGLPPETAVPAAVYLHGRAGDRAAIRLGQDALTALDLLLDGGFAFG
ncbi:MAG: NAD(P)H-hydrate dehydratase [Kiritimatiellae bacterium]|nr:NAD(P)H-hydrate dehydratase [Kiritimatiellia bacterium]